MCSVCGKKLRSEEALQMHTQSKHATLPKKKQNPWIKKGIIATILFSLFVIFMRSQAGPILPPTDVVGHIEGAPPSHKLREPMDIAIQRHVMEHTDGRGPPGVIINYNCKDYQCEPGLIENLESFADIYPNVYVAPFKNMDAKIVLSRYASQVILDGFDGDRIDSFIRTGR